MNKLSTGQDSTLGNWLALSEAVFGRKSPASRFLKDKIKESLRGKEEEVLANEGQLLNLLISLHYGE